MSQKGFTLMEIVVVIGITGIVMAMISTLLTDSFRMQRVAVEKASVGEECQRALSGVEKDMISMIEGENGAFPLALAESNQIIFYSDTDLDGTVEKIKISKNSKIITKEIFEPVNEIYPESATNTVNISSHFSQEVGDNIFAYYGSDFSGTQNPISDPISESDVRVAKISMICALEENVESNSKIVFSTLVKLRNLK